MPVSLNCPGNECWDALFGDTISPDQRERYERHLESCPVCQECLDQCLEPCDALVRLVRQVGDPGSAPTDPALNEVLERLHGAPAPVHTPIPEVAGLPFLSAADDPSILGNLGKYEVRGVIGRGGMGVVLKAFDPALHRFVAIKVMAAALAGSMPARRRFTREAQAAAAVCHDHVVTIHSVHQGEGLPYLVMQYVDGESLQARLDRAGPLEITEVVRIGMETASGLAAAHAQGLIHRDIKPANLLLENGVARVKITDFGLARTADDAQLTQSGVVAGTPHYMAPEQARGEAVDHRADLFSLGSVLYVLCTGVPPFRGASAMAVLRRVTDERPPPPRSLNPQVPAWLDAVVMQLLAKDPAQRFQSAAEVARLLAGYLAHLREPTAFEAPPLPPTPGVTRHRKSFWFPALLAVLATWGLYWWLFAAGAAPAAREAPGEFYHDFRGKKPVPPSLNVWAGNDDSATIEPEEGGLRITMPAGHARKDPAGVVLNSSVKGNFEITTGYEIVKSETPRTGNGVGYELYLFTDTPTRDAIAFTRVRMPDGSDQYICGRMGTDDKGKRTYKVETIKTTSTAARMRLKRRGNEVTYWIAEEGADEFRELCRQQFIPDDLSLVRMCAYPGVSTESVDIRLVDLRIRTDSPLLELAGSAESRTAGGVKLGTALFVVLGLAVAVSLATLGSWFFIGRRRRSAREEEAALPVAELDEPAAPSVIAFACPFCGARVKAKPDQVGHKGKCPKCAKAVLVPGAEVTTRPPNGVPAPSGARPLPEPDDAIPVAEAVDEPPHRTRGLVVALAVLLVVLLAAGGAWLLWPRSAAGQANARSFLNVRLGHEPDPDIDESGFSYQERDRLNETFRWSDGHARLTIPIRQGEVARGLEVRVTTYRPAGVRSAMLKVVVNERPLFDGQIPLSAWKNTFSLAGIDLGSEAKVEIISDTFAPLGKPTGKGKISDDDRTLGVQVWGVTLLSEYEEPAPVPPAANDAAPRATVWKGHDSEVTCAAVTPDGKTLVSGSLDGMVKVWDVAAGRQRKGYAGLAPNVTAIAVAPDGASFATASNTGTARLWETETGKALAGMRAPPGLIANLALAYSPDGRTLAVAGGERFKTGELLLWDWQVGKERATVEPFKSRLWCVAFSPDGQNLAVGGGDGMVTVLGVESGRPRAFFPHGAYVRGVAFSPDGSRLAAAYGDKGRLSLYEWQRGQQLAEFQAPGDKLVLAPTFGPDGKSLLTPYLEGTALLWDVSALPPRIVATLNSGAKQGGIVLFFPDGSTVATGADDGTLRLVKVERVK
jgi:serine/threonine protein kinase